MYHLVFEWVPYVLIFVRMLFDVKCKVYFCFASWDLGLQEFWNQKKGLRSNHLFGLWQRICGILYVLHKRGEGINFSPDHFSLKVKEHKWAGELYHLFGLWKWNVSGCPQKIITGKEFLGERGLWEGIERERAKGFVHVNVHAHSRPHLNKSGQPFRLPVPWLVHYAEAFFNLQKQPVSALKHLGLYFSRSTQYSRQALIPCLLESAYTNAELLTRLIWEIMNLSKYGGPHFAFSYENSI